MAIYLNTVRTSHVDGPSLVQGQGAICGHLGSQHYAAVIAAVDHGPAWQRGSGGRVARQTDVKVAQVKSMDHKYIKIS